MGLLSSRVWIQLPAQEAYELCSVRSWEVIPDTGSRSTFHVSFTVSLCIAFQDRPYRFLAWLRVTTNRKCKTRLVLITNSSTFAVFKAPAIKQLFVCQPKDDRPNHLGLKLWRSDLPTLMPSISPPAATVTRRIFLIVQFQFLFYLGQKELYCNEISNAK